eukprot:531250-Pleurochrysis_carterae.AAC.2
MSRFALSSSTGLWLQACMTANSDPTARRGPRLLSGPHSSGSTNNFGPRHATSERGAQLSVIMHHCELSYLYGSATMLFVELTIESARCCRFEREPREP